MNQITHWLDASNIYGSDEHETKNLREGKLGLLKTTSKTDSITHPLPSLPTCDIWKPGNDYPAICRGCQAMMPRIPSCYVAGKNCI